MKTIITLLFALGSSAALACGNFAGSFTCTVEGDNYTYGLHVDQQGNRFIITDDEGTDEFIADGSRHALPDDTNMRNASYVANCHSNLVNLVMTGDIFDDQSGQSFPFRANMDHVLKTRNHVTQTTVTEVLGQTTTTVTQCRRN